MKRVFFHVTLPLSAAIIVAAAFLVSAGDISPPVGPVAPTFKTLHEVEPRTPISQADIPKTILNSGSYYLTENLLAVGLPATAVIKIDVGDVTLDLKGFTITGSSEVSQASYGVRIGGVDNVVVRNGIIRECILDGIDSTAIGGKRILIEDILATNNFQGGIAVQGRAIIRNCLAIENGAVGIETQGNSLVTGCSAIENGDDGIRASSGTVTGCVSNRNTGDGIQATADSLISGNRCDNNGFSGGDGAGIHVTASGTRVEGNTVTDSDRGIDVDLGGNLVIRNSAAGNGTEYDIAAGNTVGPTVTSATIAGSSNPHANYDY